MVHKYWVYAYIYLCKPSMQNVENRVNNYILVSKVLNKLNLMYNVYKICCTKIEIYADMDFVHCV